MEANGHSFLDKVLRIIKEESAEDVPLIQFKHPKELEVSNAVFFIRYKFPIQCILVRFPSLHLSISSLKTIFIKICYCNDSIPNLQLFPLMTQKGIKSSSKTP